MSAPARGWGGGNQGSESEGRSCWASQRKNRRECTPCPCSVCGPRGMGWSRPHCEGGPLLSAHLFQSLLRRHAQKLFLPALEAPYPGRLTHKLMTTVRMVHFP